MISVIVPVYNVEPYLRECIESILGQTYRDFELILVNDGSTDDSGTICDEYAAQDTRIRVLHQKNSGVSVARNVGLDSVQGEYIAFVDSDDRVSKDYLAYLNDLIQIECADIACCDFLQNHPIEFSDIEKDELVYDTLTGANSCLRLYQQNGKICIGPVAKLYARHLWEGIRFPVGKIHEDQAVIPIVLYKANKVTVSQEKLYYYRVVETSIMHKPFSLKRYDDIEAVENCIAFFESQKEHGIAALAKKQRSKLLAVYSISARRSGIYDQLPEEYRMSEWKALRLLRKTMPDDKYTYYLAMIHPRWLRPHAYLRKIKKILHIPCK